MNSLLEQKTKSIWTKIVTTGLALLTSIAFAQTTISTAFFDYKYKGKPKKRIERSINKSQSLTIRSNNKKIPDNIAILFTHGFTVNPTVWVENNKFLNNFYVADKKPQMIGFLGYKTHELRPHEVANQFLFYLDRTGNYLRQRYKDNFGTIIVAHSEGTLVMWKLLQKYPYLIQANNMISAIFLGPPFRGANELARNIDLDFLTSLSEPMQDFGGNTAEMRDILRNHSPSLPKLVVRGISTRDVMKGRYKLLYPVFGGDGLVDKKAGDATHTFSWIDANFGGLDLLTSVNLDHTTLREDEIVNKIINQYVKFLIALKEKGFVYNDSYGNTKRLAHIIEQNNTRLELDPEKRKILIYRSNEYDSIAQYLHSEYDLDSLLPRLIGKKRKTLELVDFRIDQKFNIKTKMILNDGEKDYVMYLSGNGDIEGFSKKKKRIISKPIIKY